MAELPGSLLPWPKTELEENTMNAVTTVDCPTQSQVQWNDKFPIDPSANAASR